MTKEISWDEAERRLDDMEGGEMYNAEIYNEGFLEVGIRMPYIGIRTVYVIRFDYKDLDFDVFGAAICKEPDKYNEEFGKNLAKTKAYEAYHHEVKKLMIAETYRPEWKKKQKCSFSGQFIITLTSYDINPLKDFDRVQKELPRKFKDGAKVKVTIEDI